MWDHREKAFSCFNVELQKKSERRTNTKEMIRFSIRQAKYTLISCCCCCCHYILFTSSSVAFVCRSSSDCSFYFIHIIFSISHFNVHMAEIELSEVEIVDRDFNHVSTRRCGNIEKYLSYFKSLIYRKYVCNRTEIFMSMQFNHHNKTTLPYVPDDSAIYKNYRIYTHITSIRRQ